MIDASSALSILPDGLRDPLLKEYRHIIQNYAEGRWGPSELSGGLFCEIVYTIVEGFGAGAYASAPSKPGNFVQACRQLEQNTSVPRSFQILIPRLLPALYEIRNNRGVGHVGGDVDPNHMDATAVVSMCNWVMAELVRVLHSVTTEDAQTLVDMIAERQTPLVWKVGGVRRLLDTTLPLKDQILILAASCSSPPSVAELQLWTQYTNGTYFKKLVGVLDRDRFLHLDSQNRVTVSPIGTDRVAALLKSKTKKV